MLVVSKSLKLLLVGDETLLLPSWWWWQMSTKKNKSSSSVFRYPKLFLKGSQSVPNPGPKSRSQIQVPNPKSKVQRKGTGTGADTIILQATTTTHHLPITFPTWNVNLEMGKAHPWPSLTFLDHQWPSMTFYDLLSPSKTSILYYLLWLSAFCQDLV